MSDRQPDWGPLDDFEDDAPQDAVSLAKLREGERAYARLHEYVSAACVHRRHDECTQGYCVYCKVACLCVCHRYPLAVENV